MISRRALFWIVTGIFFLLFLYLIRSILLPFVLGIFIAYFLNPAVDRLERLGIARATASILLIVAFFFSIALLLLLIVPVIVSQFSGLVAALPGYVTVFDEKYQPALSEWLGGLPITTASSVQNSAADLSAMFVKFAGELVGGVFQSGMAVVHILLLILITPIVAFYLLYEWEHNVARLDSLLPRASAGTIRQQLAIIDRTLAGFLRGQLNVCLLLATYYAVGLSLAGLKFGIVIGLVTGLLVIFPYVGFLLGLTVGLFVAIFQFDTYGPVLVVLMVFLVGSIMESYFISPRLVGEKVGLHPVWIIFGMLSGAALFGLVGVLLAVPATAVIGVLTRFAVQEYLHSEYYLSGPHRGV